MAAQPQYTRGQLRDLLVEFYSRVDPARLDAGIDINGMIDWITYNGINGECTRALWLLLVARSYRAYPRVRFLQT